MSWAEVQVIKNELKKTSSHLITVNAPDYPSTNITLTDGTVSLTETSDANGVAKFYVSAGGTYTASLIDELSKTITLGSVTFDSEIIEYQSVKDACFAYHYSENDSNPGSVSYPTGYDNSDWSNDTAYMDFTEDKFKYGAWDPNGTNASLVKWLYPRSCMLKYDGTVDYYLNEDDESLREDGTASDVANMSYAGNAMMEWGQYGRKIWTKIVPDSDGKGYTFCVANYQKDEDYHCWNHYDCDNEIKDHFYTHKYFGSYDGTRLRSISGGTNMVSTTRQEEIDRAKANNTTSKNHWYTEDYSNWSLIGHLCVLISKSTNSQDKFGTGRCSSSNSDAIGQGTMDGKGMFYGKTNQTDGVKVFGIENFWGNLYWSIAGFMNISNTTKIKLTHGTVDGSTANEYNIDGTGYISNGSVSGTSGGYISAMNISNKGLTPKTVSGSETTYYTDACYFNSGTMFASVGGPWSNGSRVGVFFAHLNVAASDAGAGVGSCLSYK